MKNKVLLLFSALALLSCSEKKKVDSQLSGVVENSPNGMITLVGSEYEKDIILEEDGSFTTELDLPYDGYYNMILGRVPLHLYLEKGKDLSLNVDLEQIGESLEFTKDLGAENNFLATKQEVAKVDPREIFQLEPEEFLASLKEVNSKLNSAMEESSITNTNFKKAEEAEFQYLEASYLNSYEEAYTYLTEADEVNLPTDFYSPMKQIDMKDTLAYRTSHGYRQMLEGHLHREVAQMEEEKGKNSNIQYIELVNKNYPSGYAKNQLLKSAAGYGLKADQYLDQVYELYMANQTDESLKAAMEESYIALSKITPGKDSPSFDYENFKGGTTSLESLRGKYVYIDVWATWCMPCLMEVPYLKEVEKDYRNKDIEFVAISIDDAKDYDKWKNMVEESELVGTQLYAGGDAWQAEFAQSYRVNSIPRFILIDPEGKIFDADTYRPSDKKLRELLDEIL